MVNHWISPKQKMHSKAPTTINIYNWDFAWIMAIIYNCKNTTISIKSPFAEKSRLVIININFVFCRFGFKTDEPSGGSWTTPRKARADRPTMLTPRPALENPSHQRRSSAGSNSGERRSWWDRLVIVLVMRNGSRNLSMRKKTKDVETSWRLCLASVNSNLFPNL